MNIFNKVAFEGLKKNRSRTLVTIIGVILSAALVTAGATFGVSLLGYMVAGAEAKTGSWHVAFEGVSSSFAGDRMKDKEADEAVITKNLGYAELKGSKNPDSPYVYIVGYDDAAFDMLPVQLISGRLPENSGEVLVTGGVLTSGGVSLSEGDVLDLSVGDRIRGGRKLLQSDPYKDGKEKFKTRDKKSYTVVGICQKPAYADSDDPGYTLITRSEKGGEADSVDVFVRLKSPRGAKDYALNRQKEAAAALNDNVLRFMGASGSDIFNLLLYTVGGIAVFIIMVGSVFLIRNAFNISLNERTRQFGILMSVGATKKQLRNSVLFEGLCIGAAGIPAGVLLGIAGTELVLHIVEDNFTDILYSDVPLKMILSFPAILAAVFISFITILISAYLPARKAVRIPVMECIRQTNEVKLEGKKVRTGKLTVRLFGLPGVLAMKNFKRNKRRYRSIILSLILSVVLFIATNSFVLELKQASEAAVVFTTYDVAFSTTEMPDEDMFRLRDQCREKEGVTDIFYQMVINCHTSVETDKLTDSLKKAMEIPEGTKEADLPLVLQIVDDDAYKKLARQAGIEEEATGDHVRLLACGKVYEVTNRMKEVDEFPDMFHNQEEDITISLPEENASETGTKEVTGPSVSLQFAGMIPPDTLPTLKSKDNTADVPYVFTVMAPYSMKDKLIGPDTHIAIKGLSVSSDKSSQTEKDIKTILTDSGANYSYLLINMNHMAEQNNNMIFIANVFCYTFIAMISLIAVANVFNTISTNIKLRRRELAMLRSVGMSEREFQKMMNFECILYGLRALMWGIPLSLFTAVGIYQFMQFGADNIDFVIPWASIAISVVGVFFIVFITMMYSVGKIKKENIIDALRDDMT